MQRYSKHAPSLARKIYATTTAKRLQILEKKALSEFDGHFVVSQRDQKKLLEIAPDSRIFVADNGVDCNFYSDESIEQAYLIWMQKKPSDVDWASSIKRYRLLFVGSMDYHANVDAVEKFVKESWLTIQITCTAAVYTAKKSCTICLQYVGFILTV
jgi:glycosyltransferase involved in cell wall biosynthesis